MDYNLKCKNETIQILEAIGEDYHYLNVRKVQLHF